MTTNRTRREDPTRTEPYRQWEQLLKTGKRPGAANGAGNGANNGATANGDAGQQHANGHSAGLGVGAIDKTITDAVKLGYKIIEEQIDQGKRVAAELSGRSYSTNSIATDTTDFVKRLLRFYSDIGASCFEFIETLSRNVPVGSAGRAAPQPPAGNPAPPVNGFGSAAASRNVPIEVAADVPTRVSLDLMGPVGQRSLAVHGLHALDPATAPLRDIAFGGGSPTDTPTLYVRVPSGQPEGSYTGVVVDADTNQAYGTLSIRIGSA